MMKTWSFMIFVFHLYSAEAFGVWGDANHYICIWSFLVILVNWGNLAYAMMSYFSRPTIQSCFGRFAAICKKLCCRSFVLLCNCAVLCFAVMHATQDTKKGEAFPAYHNHDGFPVAAFPAYHRRISICAHLGHSILPSIRQTAISFHAYICLFSIAFLLLMMISWFHHFFRYELLSNVGLPHCLFFLLAH